MTKKLTVVQMLPELESGGVERGTLEMGKYLVEHGHRSIVIASGGRMVDKLKEEGSEHIDWPVGKKSLSTIRYIKKVRAFLKSEKPDILHLRSRLPAWIGYLAWKKLPLGNRPKLVTTVHGRYSVSKYSSVMVRGEKIIAVSEMIRQYILDNYSFITPADIQVIYRGVDIREYVFGYAPSTKWQEEWEHQFPQMKGKKLLTLPARLTRLKGHADFVSIIDTLVQSGQPVHGVIVGGTHLKKKAYENELKRFVAQLGMQSNITFVGQRTDLKEIMSISSIIYSLSKTPESFGRTTLEALSIGKPVIGYAHGGVQEQLEQLFPDGLVDVGDTAGAADRSAVWLSSSMKYPTRGHTLTLEQMCASTLKLYQTIIG